MDSTAASSQPLQDAAAHSPEPAGLDLILRALRNRNYRLFFIGQGISLIGTWLTRVATSWLVYKLALASTSRAEWLLGLVGFASMIPLFLFSPFSGVLVDRWNRHRILVITTILSGLQSLTLAVLSFLHIVTIPQVLVLSVAQGFINVFDMPARQAFLVEMVERREDLANAIALNSSMFNGARLIGPAIAGILIAAFGEAWCFLIDALSYIAVLAALLAMVLNIPAVRRVPGHILHELKEGFRYAFGFPPIRAILLIVGIVSFMSISYQVLLPVFGDTLSHAPDA
ncbi:MAG TPA: MFS transporter, partial [Tepidisphaeraceae bacterium]